MDLYSFVYRGILAGEAIGKSSLLTLVTQNNRNKISNEGCH